MRWPTPIGAAAATGLLLAVRRRYTAVTVVGLSMEPALRHGDRVLVRRTPGRRLRVADVVVARPGPVSIPGRGGWLVKRVAAVPGDAVPGCVRARVGVPVVPAGALVLLGDNAAVSTDSRDLGFFDATRPLGRVTRTLPPVSRRPPVLYAPDLPSARAEDTLRSEEET